MLRHMAEKEGYTDLVVDSCGMGDWHLGASPDKRMTDASMTRGIPMRGRAKLFQLDFFEKFDYIFVVDNEILHRLYHHADTPAKKAKLKLITEFSEVYKGEEIPDPFYRGEEGFEHVLDMLEDSCRGILEHLYPKS